MCGDGKVKERKHKVERNEGKNTKDLMNERMIYESVCLCV